MASNHIVVLKRCVANSRAALACPSRTIRRIVGDASAVAGLVKATLERFGAIDILVNNAVVRHFSPIVDFLPEHWDAALAVNLSAAFHAVRLALPNMRKRNFGRIFNMTSVYGSRGTINRVDYVTNQSGSARFHACGRARKP